MSNSRKRARSTSAPSRAASRAASWISLWFNDAERSEAAKARMRIAEAYRFRAYVPSMNVAKSAWPGKRLARRILSASPLPPIPPPTDGGSDGAHLVSASRAWSRIPPRSERERSEQAGRSVGALAVLDPELRGSGTAVGRQHRHDQRRRVPKARRAHARSDIDARKLHPLRQRHRGHCLDGHSAQLLVRGAHAIGLGWIERRAQQESDGDRETFHPN